MGRPQHLHGSPPPRPLLAAELADTDPLCDPRHATPVSTSSRAYRRLRRNATKPYEALPFQHDVPRRPGPRPTTEPQRPPEPQIGMPMNGTGSSSKQSFRVDSKSQPVVEVTEDPCIASKVSPAIGQHPELMVSKPQGLDDAGSTTPPFSAGSELQGVVGNRSEVVAPKEPTIEIPCDSCCDFPTSCSLMLLRSVRSCARSCATWSCGRPLRFITTVAVVGLAIVTLEAKISKIRTTLRWYHISSNIASWFRLPLAVVPIIFLFLLIGAERLLPRATLPWAHALVSFFFRLRFT
eukprot:COSAG02_NODE_16484_length_1080_cov_0.788991_1_plen_293_part_01